MTEINRDMQLLQMVSQLGPDAMQLVNTQQLARKILTDGDMSPDVIRSQREIEQMQQQMQEQMAQQQLMQGAQQLLNGQDQAQEPPQE
jgi:DNA repair protein RadC